MIPQTEYLSFVDNGVFSVDGVLSDLPVTASAIIGDAPLVIEHGGFSGLFPDSSYENYSYDPTSEYLSLIDNDVFSVDGVLYDFPVTASATIDCFAHLNKNDKPREKLLIITSEGESGDYPGCSDMAYTKAVSDGADVLDCPVQMTKDGIPFFLVSINLVDKTTIL
ncbi:hypothetical protein KY285_011121 [Solanum tuberosum]|nr:hypothetical protein KY285_011121 [Solanum tuberosum]